jgi:hypothetical protein
MAQYNGGPLEEKPFYIAQDKTFILPWHSRLSSQNTLSCSKTSNIQNMILYFKTKKVLHQIKLCLLYFSLLSFHLSLRFSQFSGCWLILSVYIIMSLDLVPWRKNRFTSHKIKLLFYLDIQGYVHRTLRHILKHPTYKMTSWFRISFNM